MDAVALPRRGHWPQLAALSLVMLLPSLGTSIANVALPTLAASFGVEMARVQWVVIAYLLAVTSLILGAGRLGDVFGRRRLLLAGIAVFALASALAAAAPVLWLVILARGVQGAGAAVMMALTIAMAGDLMPAGRTGSAMGLLGTVSAVGTALGPTLGGAVIAVSGWPAVFALLAVLAGVALAVGRALFPEDARPAARAAFDWGGTLLLALSLLAMTAALTLGAGRWAMVGLAALSGLGFRVFTRHQRLLDLDLLHTSGQGGALMSLALVSAIVMATLVVGPFHLSQALGLSAFATGLVMSVGPVVAALTGAPAGRLVDRAGASRVTVAGLGFVLAGTALLATLPLSAALAGYLAGLVQITFGYALFQAANTTAVMQGTASEHRGVTSALLGLSRNLGLILGASAMGTVYALGPGVAEAAGIAGQGAGLRVTFAVAALLAVLALGLNLRRRPAPRPEG